MLSAEALRANPRYLGTVEIQDIELPTEQMLVKCGPSRVIRQGQRSSNLLDKTFRNTMKSQTLEQD